MHTLRRGLGVADGDDVGELGGTRGARGHHLPHRPWHNMADVQFMNNWMDINRAISLMCDTCNDVDSLQKCLRKIRTVFVDPLKVPGDAPV